MPAPWLTSSSCNIISLKQIDIEFMRRLHTKVNLIPIIAKSDTLTYEEVIAFKERVSMNNVYFMSYTHAYTLDIVGHCCP